MVIKVSAMTGLGTAGGTAVDAAADYLPIVDASVADASKNKKIIVSDLRRAMGFGNPPTTSLMSFTANSSSTTQATSYDASKGFSFGRTDAGAASTIRTSFVGKAVPAGNSWTATCKIFFPSVEASSNIATMGLTLYESSSGKNLVFGTQTNNGLLRTLVSNTNLSTFNVNITATTLFTYNQTQWLRVSYDGTTYTFQHSQDNGITFATHGTAAKATYFTSVADKIGFSLVSNQGYNTGTSPLYINVQHYDDPDYL